jgi:hypothetical protein
MTIKIELNYFYFLKRFKEFIEYDIIKTNLELFSKNIFIEVVKKALKGERDEKL